MFTGLIEAVGSVREAVRRAGGLRIAVELRGLADGLKVGDSVCVSGCCLTATAIRGGGLVEFDAVAETVARTWFGDLRPGHRVNLERALKLGQRLGGHLVQGHVDGIARLRARRGGGPEGGQALFDLEADPALTEDMLEKGSVALDGVSLTLTSVSRGRFSVALIPHTLAVTTLGERRENDALNLETDLIGKWVRRLVRPYLLGASPIASQGEERRARSGGLSMDDLERLGYA